MAYLDPKSRFRMSDRVRRWFGSADDDWLGEPGNWQTRLYRDLGQFLFANRLDPTPDNYDLAFQFRAASNATLVAAIRAEIESNGVLSADAAERIFTQSAGPVSADALADFVGRIEAQASGLDTIARQSGRDANEFRTALERECGDEANPASLLALTKTMVARTRLAEAQLRQARKDLTGLKTNLAEAQRAADVDPLTDLPNRRAFKRELEKMVKEARQTRVPLSLAFCDIDHFKLVNDGFGHEVGDRVLRSVARTLAQAFAERGVVGRFGGEEFVIALPGHALFHARAALDEVRTEVATRPMLEDMAEAGPVTFSAGITTLVDADTVADLLRRADEALYRAKDSGRNRVVIG